MRYGITLVALLLVCGQSPSQAQLTVLSQADETATWKTTQLEQIAGQLDKLSEPSDLRLELESQAKWLQSWTPNGLSTKPLWPAATRKTQREEPSIDPSGLATPLRRRLLGPRAKPRKRDTDELQRLLAKHSKDVGVRQLHLHWLDQIQYRKIYTVEIAQLAKEVNELLAGLSSPNKPGKNEEARLAQAFCLYRRARALAYRELPEVAASRPIENKEKYQSQLQSAYAQLQEIAGTHAPEFILLDIRMLRRDGWNGRALKLLEEHGDIIELKWLLKKRRDILTDLSWEKPASEAAGVYAKNFPQAVEAENSKSL